MIKFKTIFRSFPRDILILVYIFRITYKRFLLNKKKFVRISVRKCGYITEKCSFCQEKFEILHANVELFKLFFTSYLVENKKRKC